MSCISVYVYPDYEWSFDETRLFLLGMRRYSTDASCPCRFFLVLCSTGKAEGEFIRIGSAKVYFGFGPSHPDNYQWALERFDAAEVREITII